MMGARCTDSATQGLFTIRIVVVAFNQLTNLAKQRITIKFQIQDDSFMDTSKQTTPDLRNLPEIKKFTLPTLAELFDTSLELAGKQEGLNALLNAEPPKTWVREHPFIKGHRYVPIDKVEYLLRKIFKHYQIEITGQGTAFNGVWVTVRVHYYNPALKAMSFVDGIGASQLQTKKDTSPSDLINVNNGAISMAFPIAKTLAIKDACQLIGNVFGGNLDRKDTLQFEPDQEIITKSREEKRKELLKQNGVNV